MRGVRGISIIRIGVGLIIIIGVIAGVGSVVTSDNRPPIGQAPPINENTTATEGVAAQSQSTTESPQTYAVTARSAETIDTAQLAEYGKVGTQADARIELSMSASDVGAVKNISWVTSVRPVMRSEPAQADINVPGSISSDTLGVQQIHQNGITGEGVEVGIISDGFELTNPAIASNIVNTRSFRETRGDPGAGTSKAEIVTRTAPDSQLHLVSAETDIDHQRAIGYLNTQDVDIIVYGNVWFYPEDDGVNFLSDEINDATVDGSLVITQPGDYAQTHWEGEFRDSDSDELHEWTVSGDELNALPDADSEFSGGDITVAVRWEDEGDLSSYKPYLYNQITGEYVAEGNTFDDTGDILETQTNHYSQLSTDVASQPLSLVIKHIQGPADDEIEVTVTQGPQSIQRNIPASSIQAPGDVPAALTVGAYERDQNQLATYSGRGPTDDGRAGIDVTGYTNIDVTNRFEEDGAFGGTFASSAYVGGVAALVEDDQPGDQSPTELTNTLKSSSDDIRDPGTDTASGSGVVNAANAVDVPVEVDVDPTDLAGGGTESNPYEISNVSELQAMENDLDANYALVSDVDASNTAQFNNGRGFDPVGDIESNDNTPSPFTGSFNGNDHTIAGLTIDRPNEDYVGLFGSSSGTVTDLTLTGVTVTGEDRVGGLVGDAGNNSVITNGTASGAVTGTENVGGLVGFSDDEGIITDATASGSVSGESEVGGAIGDNEGRIQNVRVSSDVSGGPRVGGLVGEINNGMIQNGTASGSVSGTNATGGLVGFAENGSTITAAEASGTVTGAGAVGGLIGNNQAIIQDATASGDVSGSGRFNVGGLVGFANNQSIIRNATASGDVDGPDLVGGLAGQSRGAITNATASGDVNGETFAGGLVGYVFNGSIQNATASGNVDGLDLTGGLVGFNDEDGVIANVTASGGVSGSDNVGGLAGQNNGTITTARALSNTEGESDVGGLVGANIGAVRNTTASGTVSADEFAGGLIGVHIGIVQDSFAVGDVTATTDTGGLVGNRSRLGRQGTVRDSYFDEQATGQDTSAGAATKLTTSEMQGTAAEQNMGRLEFGESWQTVSGDYPELIVLSDTDTDTGTDTDTDQDPSTDSPLEGAAGEFDTDGNGEISIIELGQAGQAFASGDLTITELGEIGAAFAS